VSGIGNRVRALARQPSWWTLGMKRYSAAHGLSAGADALVDVSVASSLFFSISADASRQQVLLYLLINLVPFTFLAPLIGPTIDRFPGSHRVIAGTVFLIRAALAVAMALTLFDLAFYFFALALLIANRATGVTKQALVPGLVDRPEHLVAANSRLSLISLIVGSISVVAAAGIVALSSAHVTLLLACVGFVAAAAMAFRLPDQPPPEDELAADADFLQVHSPMVGATAWAFTMIRVAVGFFGFGIAFALRRASEPAYVYAAVGAAWAFGSFAGNAIAPRLRRRTSEDRLTAWSLIALAIVASFGALGPSRLLFMLVAMVIGLAASVGRQGFDSLVQSTAPHNARGSVFARFETRFQLGWVAGAVAATAVRMPPRIGLAVLAVAMVPSAIFYLLNVRALRVVGADDPFNAIGLARRRIEQLAGLEPGEHTVVAVIELASVADLARVSLQTVDPALLEEIDSMRAALLAGSAPDPLAVTAAIEALRSAAAAFDEPAAAAPTVPPPVTTEPAQPAPVTWGRRAARRTSP
jgi:hypothetical protein